MANDNQSLDILIRFISQQFGVKPEEVLKQVREATKQTADENERYQQTLEKMRVAQVMESQEKQKAVKWTQSHKEGTADLTKTMESLQQNVVEGTKETEKSVKQDEKKFTSLKQVKEGLKGLAFELPIVGNLLRLLNPYTATVAGIAGATAIWKARTDELAYSLGAVPLPDVSEDYIGRIDRFAEKLKKVADQSTAAITKLKEVQATIDANAEFWKALGVDVGTGPGIAKADAASATAAQLLASGQAKIAAGVGVSPNDLEKAKGLATAAEQDNVSRRGRLGEIGEMQSMHPYDPRRLYYDNKFRLRYGYGTTYDQAAAIENQAIASNQNTIGFYANLTERASLRSAGNAEVSQAQEILSGNVGARRSIANQSAGQLASAVGAIDPSNLASIGPKFAQMFAAMMDLMKRIEEAQKELKQKQSAQNQRP